MMTKEERREYDKKYYQKHKEEMKQRTREWNKNNKERQRETAKRWNENNKEHLKELQKRSREKRKDHRKEYDKQWIENNRVQYYTSIKRWRDKNKERVYEWTKQWKEINKEYNLLYDQYYYITHRKKGYIMETHWTEKIEEIDKKIAKLNQLKQSIIEATSEPEEEQTEPTIDRYGFRKNERRIYYDLPEYQEVRDYRNMNHVPLEGASNYELYENGELFSRKEGRFVDGQIVNNSGDVVWRVLGDDGVMIDIWRKMEMKRCFPEFKEKIKSRHGLQYS